MTKRSKKTPTITTIADVMPEIGAVRRPANERSDGMRLNTTNIQRISHVPLNILPAVPAIDNVVKNAAIMSSSRTTK
jgi:hypothetical protein